KDPWRQRPCMVVHHAPDTLFGDKDIGTGELTIAEDFDAANDANFPQQGDLPWHKGDIRLTAMAENLVPAGNDLITVKDRRPTWVTAENRRVPGPKHGHRDAITLNEGSIEGIVGGLECIVID